MKKLILAIDFDGTIVDHKFPKIGKLKPYVNEALAKFKEDGHLIIIWTCRNMTEPAHPEWKEATIYAVKEFLDSNGIPYDAINENAPGVGFRMEARKVLADIYIDDRNMGGFPGWREAVKQVDFFAKHESWF